MFVKIQSAEHISDSEIISNIFFHPKAPLFGQVRSSGIVHELTVYDVDLGFNLQSEEPFFKSKTLLSRLHVLQPSWACWSSEGQFLYFGDLRGISALELQQTPTGLFMNASGDATEESALSAFCCGKEDAMLLMATSDGRAVKVNRLTGRRDEIRVGGRLIGISSEPQGRFCGVASSEGRFSVLEQQPLRIVQHVSLTLGNVGEHISHSIPPFCRRGPDWSPNGRFAVVPCGTEKGLPVSLAVSRDQGFDVRRVFGGGKTAVTCVRFLQKVFFDTKDEYTYLAMGDAQGNLSLWEIGASRGKKDGPVFLFRSPSTLLGITSIDFSPDGNLLVAATGSQALILVFFDAFEPFQKDKTLSRTEYVTEFGVGDGDFGGFPFKAFRSSSGRKSDSISASQPTIASKRPGLKKRESGRRGRPPNPDSSPRRTIGSRVEPTSGRGVEDSKRKSPAESRPTIISSQSVAPPVIRETVLQANGAALGSFITEKLRPKEAEDCRLEDGQVIALPSEHLQYQSLSGESRIVSATWSAQFDHPLKFIECGHGTLVAHSEDGFLHFLSLKTGRRVEPRLFFEGALKVVLGSNGTAGVLKRNGSLVVLSLPQHVTLLRCNLLLLLTRYCPGVGPKEASEALTRLDQLSLLLSESELVFKILGNYFVWRRATRSWIRATSLLAFELRDYEDLGNEELLVEGLSELELTDPFFKVLEALRPANQAKA